MGGKAWDFAWLIGAQVTMMLLVQRGYRRAHSHVIIAGVGSVSRIVKSTEHGLHGQTQVGLKPSSATS